MLDNKLERLQGLRLIRKLLSLLPPQSFPAAISRCLVSISRDGIQDRDLLTRSCWATIAELCLKDPVTAAETGCFSAILDSILTGNQPGNISEALIATLLYALNEPSLRHLLREDQDLQHFVASFTDCYSLPTHSASATIDHNLESIEQREVKFIASKRAILTVMRSWPGMIYFCRHDSGGRSNGIESIIQTLHMPYEDGRRHVLELLFEMLNLSMPNTCEDFDEALLAASVASQDSWQIYDGFVASEGKFLLPHISRSRGNLFDNYLSILLYSLISFGVIQGLVQVIIQPKNLCNSVRATLVLGEILHLSSRLLPPEVYRKCHSLPILMNTATSLTASAEERAVASTAISCLDRIHTLRKSTVIPCSLFLDQLLRFVNFSHFASHSESKSQFQLKQSVLHESEDKFNDFIRDSNVLSHDSSSWNWNLITNILSWSTDAFKKMEEIAYKSFMRKLLTFFKPSSRLYSSIDANDERSRSMTSVFCHYIEFLLDLNRDESKSHEFLDEIMSDLANCLSLISVENAPQNVILSSTKLLTTLSHNYFLIIGRMTSSNRGSKLLEKLGIYEYLSKLISLCPHDVYVKLIISSLDYTKEGNFSRILLTRSLTCRSESCRVYATNFMRVLLRAGVTDFKKWAIELLLHQVYDESSSVSLAALDIILEACDDEANLESLIKLRPSLLHLGPPGELILVRFASLPLGLKFLRDSQLFDPQIEKWKSSYCLKYVKIVEDLLNECLTLHFRSETGSYGRRSERKLMETEAFVPPHFYGQLAQTDVGMSLIQSHRLMDKHWETVRNQDVSTESKRVEYKASLWSVGHVGSTPLGWILVDSSGVVHDIVQAAAECPVLSIRGTLFYVLGLLASTEAGILRLKELGWQGLKHGRKDVWPLVKDTHDEINLLAYFKRKHYSHSMSSVGTKLTDPYDFLGASSLRPGISVRGVGSVIDAEEDCYGSMNPDDVRSRASSIGVHLTIRSAPDVIGDGDNRFNGNREQQSEDVTDEDRMNQATDSRSRSSSNYNEQGSSGIGSRPESFSGTTNNQSNAISIIKQRTLGRLSPIPSVDSSTMNSSGQHPCVTCEPHLSPTKSQALQHHSLTLHPLQSCTATSMSSDISVLSQAFEPSLPSPADGHGYQTLRAINRHRVHSFGMSPHDRSLFSELSPHASPTSSTSHSPTHADGDIFGDPKTVFWSLNLPLGRFVDKTLEVDHQSLDADVFVGEQPSTPSSFMGIVVPASLPLLFNPPVQSRHVPKSSSSSARRSKHEDSLSSSLEITQSVSPADTEKTIPEEEVTEKGEDTASSNPLELHTSENCLFCYKVFPPDCPNLYPPGESCLHYVFFHYILTLNISLVSTGDVNETCKMQEIEVMASSSGSKMLPPKTLKTIISSSVTSCSSAEGMLREVIEPVADQLLIRREVMRFVTNLSGSVAAKAAEQGMLK